MSTVERGDAVESTPRRGPRPLRTTLRARNEEGVRTVVTTRDGQSLVTDEPVGRGGTGSAPTPLETVVGALCGCSAVTFERAARELGLDYEGIDFDAGYRLDRRGLLGEAEVRPYFDTVDVDARVRTTAPSELLAQVVEVTEHRCPVRNLLVDAGVALTITWSAVAP
ncbi:MAG: OsmC family protein [Actinomycetota bacterium]|nr:OsmC family protein [Actinomycetota bacterium]